MIRLHRGMQMYIGPLQGAIRIAGNRNSSVIRPGSVEKGRPTLEETQLREPDPILAPPEAPPPRRSRRWLPVVILLALAAAYFLWRRYEGTHKPPQASRLVMPGGVTVTTAVAKKGNIGVYLESIGTVTPVYTSAITGAGERAGDRRALRGRTDCSQGRCADRYLSGPVPGAGAAGARHAGPGHQPAGAGKDGPGSVPGRVGAQRNPQAATGRPGKTGTAG